MRNWIRGLMMATMVGAPLLSALPCFAAIPRSLFRSYQPSAAPMAQSTKVLKLTPTREFGRGFNLAAIHPVEANRLSEKDIEKYIPQDMTPTSDGGHIATQILDRSLSTWFNSEAARSSDLVRAAHRIEKKMESDIAFGGSEPESLKHSLRFAMRASETRAAISYSGLTTAELSYQIAHSRLNLEVREPVSFLNTSLVYNHIAQRNENRDMLSVQWNW